MKTHAPNAALPATEQSGSVLSHRSKTEHRDIAYSPFGYHRPSSLGSLPAFNGQVYEQAFRGYLLGNGYRLFNTILWRLQRPDSLSPSGAGGQSAFRSSQFI